MSGHIQTQSHILFCEAFADLRKDKDLNSDKDLVNYMKSVLVHLESISEASDWPEGQYLSGRDVGGQEVLQDVKF